MHRHADDVNKKLKMQSFNKKKKLLSLCQPMNEWMTWSTIAIREFHSCPFNTIATFSRLLCIRVFEFFLQLAETRKRMRTKTRLEREFKAGACWWCRLERNLRQVSSVYNFATHLCNSCLASPFFKAFRTEIWEMNYSSSTVTKTGRTQIAKLFSPSIPSEHAFMCVHHA